MRCSEFPGVPDQEEERGSLAFLTLRPPYTQSLSEYQSVNVIVGLYILTAILLNNKQVNQYKFPVVNEKEDYLS